MTKNKGESQRAPARDFPHFALEEALVVPRAIQDKNAGRPMNRVLLADAVGRSAGSSEYKTLLSSSYKYGLTEGTEKAVQVSLTTLGQKCTKPLSDLERKKSMREAVLKPETLRRIYEHYNNGKLPSGDFFRNALETVFHVPREHLEDLENLIVKNGRFAGIVYDVSGSPHVILEAGEVEAALEEGKAEIDELETIGETPAAVPPSAIAQRPGQIFIGHGKNKTPLGQLKKVLDQLRVPCKIAIDEPHSGRPISEKVAQIMKECSSGIFIFTGDEEFLDKTGNPILRPGENVIFELGAGSVLYGNKIVIFREEGVEFPTDFKDIGYITFQKDNLDAKASDLFNELIGFGILKLSVA